VDFVFVTLCCFAAPEAEIMILQAKFGRNKTIAADTSMVFGYADRTFTGNTVYEFPALIGTAVIGRAFWTGAGISFDSQYRLTILGILLPGVIQPPSKGIHTHPYPYPVIS
jgi:hypothetical protein